MFLYAKTELRRFLRAQYDEVMSGGYPRRAAFAADIARGDIGLPPPAEDDPVMSLVARWYYELRQVDREALASHFVPGGGTERQQARRLNLSKYRLRERVDALIRKLARALVAFGKAEPTAAVVAS